MLILCTKFSGMWYTETLWSTEFLIALSCQLISQEISALTHVNKMYNFFLSDASLFCKTLRRAFLKLICSGRSSESSGLQQIERQWRSSLPPCWGVTGCWSGSCTAIITSCSRLLTTEIIWEREYLLQKNERSILTKEYLLRRQEQRRIKVAKKQLIRVKQNLWVE